VALRRVGVDLLSRDQRATKERPDKMSESEELSKNALKKKMKAEEAAKKKAAKDAEKAAKSADVPKKEKLGGDEIEYDPTQYYENRLRTVNNMGVCFSSFFRQLSFTQL
jgi:hypothetical protein